MRYCPGGKAASSTLIYPIIYSLQGEVAVTPVRNSMPLHPEEIAGQTLFVNDLLAQINQVIVGQEKLVERVLTALLADGHVLLEGVPGLAKTLLIKTTA